MINANAFSLDFDFDYAMKTNNNKANLTFGKYNQSFAQSSLELVEIIPGFKSYLVKSLGFTFENSTYNFGPKSYVQFEPFLYGNAIITQNEKRYNESRTAYENVWRYLTNSTHKIEWD